MTANNEEAAVWKKLNKRQTLKVKTTRFWPMLDLGAPRSCLSPMRWRFSPQTRISLRARRFKKFKIALRDWNFQSLLKCSSEPPNKPLFFVRNSEGRDWKFQSGLKISSEIEIFNRDWIFSIFGPLGIAGIPAVGISTMKCKLWTETLECWRWKVPSSRFALHGLSWKLKPGFINRVLVAVIFEASKCF